MKVAEELTAVSEAERDYTELRIQLEKAVRRLCPPWLADRREDLAQTALVKVMEVDRRSGASQELSATYLWRTAQSALVDEIRRLRRRGEVALDEEVAGPTSLEAHRPGPEREAAARQAGREVWDCLGRLIRPRRLAVSLHLEGYSSAEAAPLLGWNTKKVYNLTHRGLGDLRDCLRSKGIQP